MANSSAPSSVSGLPLTFELLAKTPNEAAIGVLIPALDAEDPAIQLGALRAILDRRSPVGQKEILKRLHTASHHWRAIIDERRGRMTHALRDGVLGCEHQLCQNACQAILWFREYDLVPALVTAMDDQEHPACELLGSTLLGLADLLYEELTLPRDYANRRDPLLVRRNVTGSLEAAVRHHGKNSPREIVDAFLMLAGRDNATLKQILQDPHHVAYLAVVDSLLHNSRLGVMRLLLSFLDDPHAPSAAISVLSHRSDPPFIQLLLQKIGGEPSPQATGNLKRIDSLTWLRGNETFVDHLDEAGQQSLLSLVMASSMKRGEVLRILERLLRTGTVGGRRAAARALNNFNGAEANALALAALEDTDPQVQAAIVTQLRQRGIPGALGRLIDLVDHPDETVAAKARESLSEFNFDRFVAAFDMLDDEVRRSTGSLVKKVSPQAVATVREEMQSLSRMKRLRALGIADAMQAVGELEEEIVGLLADSDHLVRAEAARVLGGSRSAAARAALHSATGDRSPAVREAAERTLEQLSQVARIPSGS